jgi:hypothetical protein
MRRKCGFSALLLACSVLTIMNACFARPTSLGFAFVEAVPE